MRSRIIVLLQHLLKWECRPGRRGSSWAAAIGEQRIELLLALEDSPSLRQVAERGLGALYAKARRKAAQETGLNFLPECPCSLAQILDEEFLPEAGGQ